MDAAKYGRLLARTKPKVIETEREYERLAGELEKLDFSKEAIAPEQKALAELLARLIEDYEERRYPVPEASPPEVLRFLMEQRGLRQADLVGVVGSRSLVSDIVNGKRAVSKRLAKKLAAHFHVSAEVFL
ncbi:MAG: helix-turn-helix domain-containing protein [bacterium]|nr:helix-turn-helix domain-containing protein [bacterium]